ncbi:Uncharacterized membrane protein YlmG [Paucilactobacillus oligofermentans DSM 15707 = LMG 22743]|nr:YggT family protein [Paucilactobacillus oligofermentans]CUS26488.1 Uncharacterized membrane protein YlmG [Paucilactobacillus oligofermentans DSM 15707 = LMG 22743]
MENLLGFIFYVVTQLLQLYMILIVVWALMTWFPGASQSKLGIFINRLVEPYIRLFDFIPSLGGIGFSPLIALLVLQLAQYGVSALQTIVANALY